MRWYSQDCSGADCVASTAGEGTSPAASFPPLFTLLAGLRFASLAFPPPKPQGLSPWGGGDPRSTAVDELLTAHGLGGLKGDTAGRQRDSTPGQPPAQKARSARTSLLRLSPVADQATAAPRRAPPAAGPTACLLGELDAVSLLLSVGSAYRRQLLPPAP